MAGGAQRGEVADLGSVDPLLGEHQATGEVGVHQRHADAAAFGGGGGEHLGVGELLVQVELLAHAVEELPGHLGGTEARAEVGVPLEQAGRLQQGVLVALEELVEPWASHLDDDLVAAEGLGRVHLGDGRAGDRGPVEAGERLVDRRAELLLEDDAHGALGGGERAERRCDSSSHSAGGNRSDRVEATWPSFTKSPQGGLSGRCPAPRRVWAVRWSAGAGASPPLAAPGSDRR